MSNAQQADGSDDTLALVASVLSHSRQQHHANTLASGTEQHELAATKTLDEGYRNERRKEVRETVESAEKKRHVPRHSNGLLENDGYENDEAVMEMIRFLNVRA